MIQRVSTASVEINKQFKAEIGNGLLIFAAFEDADTASDIQWMTQKIIKLRIFNDEEGKMNHSIEQIEGEILVISQFTLFAATKKGNRPSYIRSAKPDVAIPLYEQFLSSLSQGFSGKVASGEFGADMKVGLLNDGPVTICIDSQDRA